MNKRSSNSGLMLAAILMAAAGIAAFKRRPVKPPERAGTWQPVESQRTRRK